MRIILIGLLCCLWVAAYPQKKKHPTSLSVIQRAALFCYLMQPEGFDSCASSRPNRYAPGEMMFRFKYSKFNKQIWQKKLPYMFEVLFRYVLTNDSIGYYNVKNMVIYCTDSTGGNGYSRDLDPRKITSPEVLISLIGGALPYSANVRICRQHNKPMLEADLYTTEYITLPADSTFREVYATMLSIALCDFIGNDRYQFGGVEVSVHDNPDADVSYRKLLTIDDIEQFMTDFETFLIYERF